MSRNIRPAKVISIIERKGGVGKTTIMHHLCAGLVLKGYDALAIEGDDNTRLRAILAGLEVEGEQELDDSMTAYNLLAHPDEGTGRMSLTVSLDRLWERTPHLAMNELHSLRAERGWAECGRFDYIPGSESMAHIDDEFARRALKERGFEPDIQLARALVQTRQQYDVIVIDSPPSVTNTFANIVAASTHVIIPVEFDYASIEDYKRTMKMYNRVVRPLRTAKRPHPETPFVLFNRFNERNPNHRRVYEAYTREHDEMINGQKITKSALITNQILGNVPFDIEGLIDSAAGMNRSIHQYAPKSPVGIAMNDMVSTFERAIGLV